MLPFICGKSKKKNLSQHKKNETKKIPKNLPAGSVAPKTDEKLLSDTNVLFVGGGAAAFVVPLKPFYVRFFFFKLENL